jgi:hypothetical protein
MKILIAAGNCQDKNIQLLYDNYAQELTKQGYDLKYLQPDAGTNLTKKKKIIDEIESFDPFFIHIGPEGKFTKLVKNLCISMNLDFTTLCINPLEVPDSNIISDFLFKKDFFHKHSFNVLALSDKIKEKLNKYEIKARKWMPGINTELFRPLAEKKELFSEKKPLLLYVLDDQSFNGIFLFIDSNLPGTKLVAGPTRLINKISHRFSNVLFKSTDKISLTEIYNNADVTVITDGSQFSPFVPLQSLACGVPVATVEGNVVSDLLKSDMPENINGNIKKATESALCFSKQKCREIAMRFSIEASTKSFIKNQVVSYY